MINPKDWAAAIVEVVQLKPHIWFAIFCFCVIVLVIPANLATSIGINAFLNDYRFCFVLVGILSFCFLASIGIYILYEKIRSYKSHRVKINRLSSLSDDEYILLADSVHRNSQSLTGQAYVYVVRYSGYGEAASSLCMKELLLKSQTDDNKNIYVIPDDIWSHLCKKRTTFLDKIYAKIEKIDKYSFIEIISSPINLNTRDQQEKIASELKLNEIEVGIAIDLLLDKGVIETDIQYGHKKLIRKTNS